MKIIKLDYKKKILKFKIESLDDLWHLSQIIDKGDIIKGHDTRKIKLSETKIIKKSIFLTISIEKIEFSKFDSSLRVLGKIIETSSEDVTKGTYHSFNIEENFIFELEKKEFFEYQKKHIIEATKEKKEKIMIVILDRGEATFALLRQNNFEIIGEISGDVENKYIKTDTKTDFFNDVLKLIEEYKSRHKIDKIVIGGSNFWINKIKGNYFFVNCYNSGKSGINEVLRGSEFRKFLNDERISFEISLVEELLKEISKEGKAVYGFRESYEKSLSGAVKILLVADILIQRLRQEDNFLELERMMKAVELSKGEIHIINSDNDGGKKLEGIGGVGAILRY